MHPLVALQNSSFAYWLSQSAYPIIITLHSVGMALLVGLLALIDLRILGIGRGLPIPSLRRYMRVVWLGFWTNAISGTLLWCISPVKFLDNNLFRAKLSLIVAGLIFGAFLNTSLLTRGDEYALAGDAVAPPRAKTLAVLSLGCWIAAIITGRLLAYSTFADVGIGHK